MKKALRVILFTFFVSFMVLPNGCQTYEKFGRYVIKLNDGDTEINPFLTHRSPVVSFMATSGSMTGFVAGLPFDIPCGLFVYFLEPYCDRNIDEVYWIFAPSVILAAAGEHALGVPTWIICGWWWPDPNANNSNAHEGKKTDRPSSDKEKTSTDQISP